MPIIKKKIESFNSSNGLTRREVFNNNRKRYKYNYGPFRRTYQQPRIHKNWKQISKFFYGHKFKKSLYSIYGTRFDEVKINYSISVHNNLNNFYVVLSSVFTTQTVVYFLSCGMIDRTKRNLRKNYYTIELCGRFFSNQLKQRSILRIYLFFKSYMKKKLLKTFLKGFFEANPIRIERIFDHRTRAHNGCLNSKIRRI